ncbi:MAG: sulfite exporter TauE/SafE family protein [Clostridia bacterium]|nr:sulfite exporter TauE/SafE family protein [Clostridia bacterium]
MNILISSTVAIFSGFLASMGFGGGSFLIIYLTLFKNVPQILSQGINLIFFIPISVVALALHHKRNLIVWKYAVTFAIIGILGALSGYFILDLIDPYILRKLLGLFLLIIGSIQIFR